MGTPFTVVASGGIPVVNATNGTPMDFAANGFGIPVTVVLSGGIPCALNVGTGMTLLSDLDGQQLFDLDGQPLWSST
jgi:hypothetical protein